jgi:hypothetical protein
MISTATVWMKIDMQKRVRERRVGERRVTERRVMKRRVTPRIRKTEIVCRPMQEARNVGIISKCGRWLLNKLGLKKTRSD